jgi:PAS domain-containing protein
MPELQPPKQPIDLQFIYDTAPIGLAFLSPDCRYLHINQRLTEICGISVADHLGRSVRERVPKLSICRSIVESHGGRLWASPGTPHGTVFQFTIPNSTMSTQDGV